eukprot:TRINITY_DN3063_c0_g1_i4.p1 TRINITY_DN3063_c0_g1~~TRINITY_DN3063_c0_g1_i4.p1  ORF type:complete len:132 (+),score=7.98 TRINITY_DN3063_c0_g1_i4:131-526(+)
MEQNKRCQIPAFGNWDFSNDLPITQYFESARQAGLLHHGAGVAQLQRQNSAKTTTVSRTKTKESAKCYQHVNDQKRQGRVCDVTQPPRQCRPPRAVDEDLYKIPTEVFNEMPHKKKLLGTLSRCRLMKCFM